jgi:transcriptional regulator with XRE-family HTH domain
MSVMDDTQEWGRHLRQSRQARGWSLADVAERAQLSRAYISAIERGKSKRPGAEAVRRLESVLGIWKGNGSEESQDMPAALASVAEEHGLSSSEVEALAGIRIRGRQPQTKQRWDFIFNALLASEALDNDVPSVYQRSLSSEQP